MTTRRAPAGAGPSRRAPAPRRHRPRPTPKWLAHAQDLDQIAKARCLLVLDILSGRTPVTEAIQAAKISRGTYYHLETRALQAMLLALTPGMESPSSPRDQRGPTRRIATLEAQVRRLEQAKRRAERLLVLTRKVVHPRRLTTSPGPGRPRLTPSGGRASPPRPTPGPLTKATASTPTPAGAGAP